MLFETSGWRTSWARAHDFGLERYRDLILANFANSAWSRKPKRFLTMKMLNRAFVTEENMTSSSRSFGAEGNIHGPDCVFGSPNFIPEELTQKEHDPNIIGLSSPGNSEDCRRPSILVWDRAKRPDITPGHLHFGQPGGQRQRTCALLTLNSGSSTARHDSWTESFGQRRTF